MILKGFSVYEEAVTVVIADGVGVAVWRGRLARWCGRRGVVGLGGWSRGGREAGLVDGRCGRIEAGSFATLRMTGFGGRGGLCRG